MKNSSLLPTKPALLLCACLVLSLLGGCASNHYSLEDPIVPGSDLSEFNIDLYQCKVKVRDYLGKDKGSEESGIMGAALGGLLGGASTGDLKGAVGGAVLGAILGVAGSEVSDLSTERSLVIDCMQKLGYNMVED